MTHSYLHKDVDNVLTQPRLLTLKCRLKWFNPTKGFGFVLPDDHKGDAFSHISVLQKLGLQKIGQQAYFLCKIFDTAKGLQVSEIEEIFDLGNMEEPIFIASTDGDVSTYTIAGTVKWFKKDKGFGFVTAEDGMKDIFIHKSCLEKLGLDTLLPGQKLRMTVKRLNSSFTNKIFT